MKKKCNLFLFLFFLTRGIYSQISVNDTILNFREYQKYINTSHKCIKYIKNENLKDLKNEFYFKNQSDENFNKKTEEIYLLLKKYGVPSDKSLLVTSYKMKVEDKLAVYIKIEFFLDMNKYSHSISFLFEKNENNPKVLNMGVFEKKTDEELLKEFQEFEKNNN